MALSTGNINSSNGNMPKTINPGLNNLKLNNLELQRFPYMEKDDAYYLVMHVETAPIENFEGFFLDPQNESLGRHEGQVGRVKENTWYYKTFTTKKGDVVDRDVLLLGAIKRICEGISPACVKWFEKVDNKYETIEDFVEGFNEDCPFKDVYTNFVVAGKEYLKKNGRTGVDMFLPKAVGENVNMHPNAENAKLLAYNAEEMFTRLEVENSDDFESNDDFNSDEDADPFNEDIQIDDTLEL